LKFKSIFIFSSFLLLMLLCISVSSFISEASGKDVFAQAYLFLKLVPLFIVALFIIMLAYFITSLLSELER